MLDDVDPRWGDDPGDAHDLDARDRDEDDSRSRFGDTDALERGDGYERDGTRSVGTWPGVARRRGLFGSSRGTGI